VCGIVGAVGLPAAPDPPVAEAILEAIRHRGPDAGGHRFRRGVWLGARRLKILDLRDDANQPMLDTATGTALVYNGELYNFFELRRELEGLGHRFSTSGDTEVMLRGYLEWGEALWSRCNGMWALAVDDPRRDGVLLCRDRFGEKPLYLGRDAGGAWWFGSEPGALREAGAGSGRFDRARILNFLAFGDSEDPEASFFDGIRQLAPGHSAVLTAAGLSQPRAWWSVSDLAAAVWDRSQPESDDVCEELDRAVRLRLRSDVSVGSSLSGGVDSSTVLASIRRADPARPLHVFTASFPQHPVDEWQRARRVAERFEAAAHRVEPTLDGFLAELPLLVRRQGGPFESPSVYAQWCVMGAAASAGVVVLLDGQGADETWGGYPKYVWFAIADALVRADGAAVARIVRAWRQGGGLPAPDLLQVLGLALPDGARRRARLALRGLSRWVGPALRDTGLVDPQGRKTHGPLLLQAAVSDATRVLLPRLLRFADRNSMAWSRELRLPFLDPRVAEVALASGWRRGLELGWTKERLRRLAAVAVSPEIAWRREKTAYDVPEREWRADGRVQAQARDAHALLADLGILAHARREGVPLWRVLTLACFLDQTRLTA